MNHGYMYTMFYTPVTIMTDYPVRVFVAFVHYEALLAITAKSTQASQTLQAPWWQNGDKRHC